jgi:hypothetical protein
MLLFFSAKKSNQKKLSAAPCSIKGCDWAGPVVAEQAKADLGTGFDGFCWFTKRKSKSLNRKNPLNGEALFNTFKNN